MAGDWLCPVINLDQAANMDSRSPICWFSSQSYVARSQTAARERPTCEGMVVMWLPTCPFGPRSAAARKGWDATRGGSEISLALVPRVFQVGQGVEETGQVEKGGGETTCKCSCRIGTRFRTIFASADLRMGFLTG